jgi:hypothetical protein
MGLGHDALAVQGGDQRDLEPLDQPAHLVAGPAADGPEPGQHDDGLVLADGLGQDRGDLLHPLPVGQDRPHVEPDVTVVLHLQAVLGEVLRHVDVHRAWPPLERQVDRFLKDVAGVSDVADEEGLLGGGLEHLLRVRGPVQPGGLVERPAALPVQRRVARDGQDRVGVGHRHREPGEQVERAWPGRGEADPQLVGVHRVAAGHERRGLLVPGDHRADPLRVL